MADMVLRNLDDDLKQRLRERAGFLVAAALDLRLQLAHLHLQLLLLELQRGQIALEALQRIALTLQGCLRMFDAGHRGDG